MEVKEVRGGATSHLCVCVCVQAHVHDHAWRPEDEQPHGDQHHAGGLSGGPQDPGGVLDAVTEQLTGPNRNLSDDLGLSRILGASSDDFSLRLQYLRD